MHITSSPGTVTKARWRPVVQAGLAILLTTGGCGLRLDVIEPAPDGGPGHDAAVDASSSCAERVSPSSGRCEVPSIACGIATGCPASWADAQQPSSCTGNGAVGLAQCAGANSWTIFHEFSVLACYYDPTTGKLQGFHEEADHLAFCGDSTSARWVGNVPSNCASDGGAYSGGFSCTPVDAGLDEPVPCGNTICPIGQYCRAKNDSSSSATCDPSAGFSGGTCVPIPPGCAQTATCDCLAALSPGCACCAPRGGGVISCSGS